MIRVRLFREADLPEVREMNPDMAEEICDFSELIPESIVAAEEEDRFLGAAYLAKTSSFMRPELGDGRCFVRGRFRAVPGDALEIEASEALLHALQESVRKLQDQDPEHRVILQIFRDAKELLSQLVEEERQRKRISGREFMGDHGGHDMDDDFDDEDHYN